MVSSRSRSSKGATLSFLALALLAWSSPALEAHPGNDVGIQENGFLQGESYDQPISPDCDPDADHEHTRVVTTSEGEANEAVIMPHNYCGVTFGQLVLDEHWQCRAITYRVTGANYWTEGKLRMQFNDQETCIASFETQSPSGYRLAVFNDTIIPPGTYTVNLTIEITRGFYYQNILVDRIIGEWEDPPKPPQDPPEEPPPGVCGTLPVPTGACNISRDLCYDVLDSPLVCDTWYPPQQS